MNELDPDMDDPTGSEPSSPGFTPDPNAQMIGRFVVEYMLGRGGMGEVYKARDPENNRYVALKVLDTRSYDDPDVLKRFEREAKAALVLDHPNIARFFGTERDQEDRPIIVMEYIDGRGLDALLDTNPEMPYSQRLDYIIQAARGLENAYRRSIIHRDIKPGNLIVDAEDHLKIIDFGLAKSLWDNSNLTGTGLVVGTPRYISPEQGMGRSVDHRSDIYSLGATCYEVMTGQTPYDGDTPLAIMMKHINSPLTPPHLVNPRIPGDINEIIMKMMAKDPGHRYQDYEPLIRDLESAKITRLAKERRAPGNLSSMQTVVLPENTVGLTEQQAAANTYLTEGLVNVDLPDTSEPAPSRARLVLLSISGLIVLGFATLLFMKPVESEGGTVSSLGQKLGQMFSRVKERSNAPLSDRDIAAKDADDIQTTRARMEAVVSHLLREKADGNNALITIAQLREKGAFTAEETRDAWDNDFFITDSGGGGLLVAPGRDGRDGTDDDFRMSLDGSTQVIPKAIETKDEMKEATSRSAL